MIVTSVLASILIPAAPPASAQILVLGASVQEAAMPAGERYNGEIRLQNQGGQPQAVRIYQTDYLFHADGSNEFPSPGTGARSNAEWIVLAPTEVVVPPGEDAAVAYEVSIPAAPDLNGTYWSMVMVEPLQGREGGGVAADGVGVRTAVRFGIQIATHVGTLPSHDLALGEPRMIRDQRNELHLELDLVNTGTAGYRPRVSVEIYDQAGVLRTSTDVQRGLLYPGTSVVQRMSLGDLSTGLYQAVVVIDTGAEEVFGAQFSLTLGAPD